MAPSEEMRLYCLSRGNTWSSCRHWCRYHSFPIPLLEQPFSSHLAYGMHLTEVSDTPTVERRNWIRRMCCHCHPCLTLPTFMYHPGYRGASSVWTMFFVFGLGVFGGKGEGGVVWSPLWIMPISNSLVKLTPSLCTVLWCASFFFLCPPYLILEEHKPLYENCFL